LSVFIELEWVLDTDNSVRREGSELNSVPVSGRDRRP